ncbi:hypothetical protein [Micromonospora sp. WMMD1082]|uniref:hypothetical protein n=1 Tax=Micromonospora sp. WMMD1082 TaxID=3016104 RepID=UPI0024180B61|nr:hypothetical protein [Micromonospora sp. WMMD1082]MDG4796977.1 hypothetical protein [Micromonospora sp. WMMD1082]
MPRRRKIEVLKLAQRIEAELASGRVDEVELSDEQVQRLAGLLRPPTPTPPAMSTTATPAAGGRFRRWLSQSTAAVIHVPTLFSLAANAPPPL